MPNTNLDRKFEHMCLCFSVAKFHYNYRKICLILNIKYIVLLKSRRMPSGMFEEKQDLASLRVSPQRY